jgi:hypothetical protein
LLFWGAGGVFGPHGYEPGGPRAVTADVRGGSGAAIELRTKGDRSPVAAVRELPVGPSLVFHELADRLSLEDTAGERPFARELASRRVGGLPVLMVVGLALLLAIAGKLAQLPRQLEGRGEERQPAGPSPSAALAATATVVVCGYLSWRSWFLFAISPPARLTVALGGGALLAWAALVVAVRPARAPLAAGVDRLQRELGVLPAVDLARGAAWLESHGLDLAGRLVAGAAVVMLVILLVR